MMDLSRIIKADELFKENKITSYDVLVLTIIEILKNYEKETGKTLTWDDYLDNALKLKENDNNCL